MLGSRYLSLSSKMVCLRGGQGPDRKWPGTTPSSALKAVRGLLAKRRKCFAGFCGSVVLVACADADSAWHAQPGTPPSPHNSLDFRGRIGSSSHCDWKLPRAWAEDRGANALDGAYGRRKKSFNFLASMSSHQGVGSKGGVCPHHSNAIGPDRPEEFHSSLAPVGGHDPQAA